MNTQDTKVVKQEASGVLTQARALLEIKTETEFAAAADFLTGVIAPMKRKVAAVFGPIKKSIQASLNAARDQERDALAPVEEAETEIKRALATYRRRVEETQRLALEAAREAEEEDRKRREAAFQRAAEAEAAAAAAESEEEARAAQEAAERAMQEAEKPPEVALVEAAPTPAAAGVSFRSVWKYEVLDAGKLHGKYVKPDLGAIRKVVTALGKDAPAVLGTEGAVRVWQEDEVAARAAEGA